MALNICQNSNLLFYVKHFSFNRTFCILHSSLYSTFKFVFCSRLYFALEFSFYSTVRILHSNLHFIYWTICILHSTLYSANVQVCIFFKFVLYIGVFILFNCTHFTFKFAFHSLNFLQILHSSLYSRL